MNNAAPENRSGLTMLKSAWQAFGPHFRPYRHLLLAGVVCLIAVSAFNLLRPWPLKLVFDALLMPRDDLWLFAWFPALRDETSLLLAGIAFSVLAIAALVGLFGYGHTLLLNSVGQRVLADLRRRLFSHLQQLSHSFHQEHKSGDLMMRLISDIRSLREQMLNSALFVAERGLYLAGMAVVMLLLDWQLALTALLVLPPVAWCAFRYAGRIRNVSRKQRAREGEIAAVVSERIGAFQVVKAFNHESHESRQFGNHEQASLQAGLEATRLEAHMGRLVEVILAVGTCAVLWFGVVRVQAGALTPGDLVVFLAYLKSMHKPVQKIATLNNRIARAGASVERVVSILETEPEIKDAPDAIDAPAFIGELCYDKVTFAYRGQSKSVLTDASFHLAPGETVAVVGPSGAGKSTLANLLLRFFDPDTGRVMLDGHDLRHYTLNSLRSQIATVLQESILFNGTIRENIAYGRLDATGDEIVAAARSANALDFILELDKGFDTEVTERGGSLSGGQRQRIAIARAMLRNSPLLILDEPLTGLDASSWTAVKIGLDSLRAGRTTLHITHELRLAAEADKVLLLAHGRVAGFGTHLELINDNPLYRNLCQQQRLRLPQQPAKRGVA